MQAKYLSCPAGEPHKFRTGPDGYEAIHIHANPTFVQRSANVWHAIELPATRIAGDRPTVVRAASRRVPRPAARQGCIPGRRPSLGSALVEEQDVSEVDSGELVDHGKPFGQFGELQNDVEQETL